MKKNFYLKFLVSGLLVILFSNILISTTCGILSSISSETITEKQTCESYLGNNPPEIARGEILGPRNPVVGKTYTWYVEVIDPDGDMCHTTWNWNDDTPLQNTSQKESGEEHSLSHTFYEAGQIVIYAKAIDVHGAESDWARLTLLRRRNFQLGILDLFQSFMCLKLLEN